MFGIVRPCRHRLSEGLATSWTAHLCGLCLALRDDHGHLARVATNYDGLIISVLTEAQSVTTGAWRRTAGPCPLRGMRGAPVATGEGARLAAAVSLVLASAKVRDRVADRDGLLGRRPVAAAARRVAGRWDRAAARTASAVGFDTAVLLDAVDRQSGIEASATTGTSLLTVTDPTETATAAAFAHTAVLAGRPGNAAPLREAGRLFGRLAHLLDAVEDLTADTASGAWNPLTATGTSLAEARRLCDDAVHGVRLAMREVEFTDGRLAHALLCRELPRSVDRAFGTHASCGTAAPHASYPPPPPGGPYGDPHGTPGPNPYAQPGPGPYGTPGPNPYGDPYANPYAGGPGGPGGGFPPPQPPRGRGPLAGCALWLGLCCTCQVCCRDPYHDPWTGQPRSGWCRGCDCGDSCCDGLECCECCECLQCCECLDCGGC
ncbi:DUF5685 family protein [Streptomyces sp. ICBB 8177]|uniref:DUF5685 family protein n=1 Tax=Streptomyces sp. ICBB 8177 TaxID=563922 RepID=UPI000D674692|nr:DUF5685 family protein [Streptomyces sp. ICBB 8177]PWI41815.1 hypothetical protein CK485_23670 [Streptomyces sp. ICBB 8177]